MRSAIVVLAASLSIACSSEPAADGASALALPGELELDRRGTARILGRLEPAIPNGDPDRVLVVRTDDRGRPIEPALEGARVLDARFAGDRLVVLGADHVLRAYGGGQVVELDSNAEPPLSVAGSRVAYVRGEMPFFEVALADASSGLARQLTQGMAPAWSPAIAEDGSVVFASSVEGAPRLHRVDASGAVIALPRTARTPSSPEAPRVEGERLFFRDEAGAAVVDLRTGQLSEAPR